jgi:hypothetical protein
MLAAKDRGREMAFKVLRRSGRSNQEVLGAPFFESWDEAANWAADYMSRPDFNRGVESIDIRQVFGNAKRFRIYAMPEAPRGERHAAGVLVQLWPLGQIVDLMEAPDRPAPGISHVLVG